MKRTVLLVALATGITAIAIGQSVSHSSDHGFFQTQDMKWMDGPTSLPKGAKVAMLEGDPTKEGPFTMRLQLPDAFKIQPHSHPAVEHVTVISGTFNLGMGEKFESVGGRALTAGSFAFMPPGMKHFAWTSGETVIQVHALDPGRSIT